MSLSICSWPDNGWMDTSVIGAFQDINVDKGGMYIPFKSHTEIKAHQSLCVLVSTTEKETKFATLDIVLGALYIATCAIALFGVIAATMTQLIDECTEIVQGHNITFFARMDGATTHSPRSSRSLSRLLS
ncbi:hypothetical protein NM688_g8094 [Phlebia brevispora]|uniref:Uncharacterized protein n=1 Tax=Phlebia brevispora TaxID=194682 RepID=A0ACC1RXL2_9APHY|nr:hypothetical protein NM688_g8094 [Phlebia brevispora]